MAIPRFYLFVNDLGTAVWRADGKTLAEQGRFPADLDGMVAFEAMVARHPDAHWYLLFDLLEEDYRIETIPHASARDRRLMADRRLQQLYRESGYRSYAWQGRENEGRRDHRVLFTALTNPTPLDRWVIPLTQAGARIAGIYSIALLSAKYLARLKSIPPKALIASRQTGSGLRQTYIADGALRFSRLTAIEDERPAALASDLIAEAARARQFLASLRALERNEAMQVVMLCSADEQAALREQCPDSELIQYHFVDMLDIARQLGSAADPGSSVAEPMWLRLVARHAPINQYASFAQRKTHIAWQLGRVLISAGVLLLLVGLLAGLHFWRSSQALDQQIATLEQRTATAEATYAANLAVVKEGELTPTGMKNVVQSYRQLIETWPDLAASLKQIADTTVQFPMLDLDAIAWQVSSHPAVVPAGLLDTEAGAQQTTAQPEAPPAEGEVPAGGRYLIIGVRGQLLGYQLRYREALALVDNIAQALQLTADAKVEKLQLPIDIRPESTIDLGSNNLNTRAGAPFAIKIVLTLTQPAQSETPPEEAAQ